SIQSVMDDVVVVQGLANSRALTEGSVLLLDDARVGIGRIEEVFGPVALPFYALRWAPGPGGVERKQPESLKAGALTSVVGRLAGHIKPEELCGHVKGSTYGADQDEEEEEEEEPYFSDDEAEAAYRWKQQAKRKAEGTEGAEGGGGRGGGGKTTRKQQPAGGRRGGRG
ncbi:Gar1/Naf1 RNA binding region-domain-containing protein, partial [Dunaliella salina]